MNRKRALAWSPLLVGAVVLLATLGGMYRDRLFPPAPPPVAIVERASGVVRVDGTTTSSGATVGQGQRIEADAAGRAQLTLPSGERLDLRGAGAIELLKLGATDPTELWLRRGTLRVDGPSHQKRVSPIVYTRDATVSVLSARLEIVSGDAGTTVRVGRGRVHVAGLHRTSVTVGAGQRLELQRGDLAPAAPEQPVADPQAITDLTDGT